MPEDVNAGADVQTATPPAEPAATSPAPGTEPSPTPEGQQAGEPEPTPAAPEERKIVGYRLPNPDGSYTVLTPEQYQQRLTGYPNLTQSLGTANNNNAELKREIESVRGMLEEMRKRSASDPGSLSTDARQSLEDLEMVDFDEDDFDDPTVMKAKMAKHAKNIEVMRGIAKDFANFKSNLTDVVGKLVTEGVSKQRQIDEAESHVSTAIQADPILKNMAGTDPNAARDFVLAAMNYANRINSSTGQEAFSTVPQAIAAYRAAMSGQAPKLPQTQQGFIQVLREGDGFVPPPSGGGGGVNDDVVSSFSAKMQGSGAGSAQKYYDSLPPEKQAVIDKAVEQGKA